MLESLFDSADVLQKSMQGLSARQRAIGENVANADTPGYKRVEVGFERKLRAAIKGKSAKEDLPLETTDDRHFSLGPLAPSLDQVQPDLNQITNETYRNDGNNVDIEAEMSKLAETNVRYNTMATLSKNKFDSIKNLIRDLH